MVTPVGVRAEYALKQEKYVGYNLDQDSTKLQFKVTFENNMTNPSKLMQQSPSQEVDWWFASQ
jgi:ribonucleotide reductase beta subunit family protein with ferritin-like domain